MSRRRLLLIFRREARRIRVRRVGHGHPDAVRLDLLEQNTGEGLDTS